MAILLADGGGRLSGRLGGRVYRQVGGATVVAAAPQASDPRTTAQLAQRARLDLANRLWAEMPLDAIARWRAYAAGLHPPGKERRARGDNLFRGLAAKYLQVHGGSAAPTEPPTSAFLGDGVVVAATPSFRSGKRKEGPPKEMAQKDGATVDWRRPPGGMGDGDSGEARPALSPQPPLSRAKEGEIVGVAFAASSPNSPGVVTELLVQRLPARHRLPKARDYRTRAFVAFAGEAVVVPTGAGAYACAIRFVRSATGQATAMVPLGVVEVG